MNELDNGAIQWNITIAQLTTEDMELKVSRNGTERSCGEVVDRERKMPTKEEGEKFDATIPTRHMPHNNIPKIIIGILK
jgi:hypothetical protein